MAVTAHGRHTSRPGRSAALLTGSVLAACLLIGLVTHRPGGTGIIEIIDRSGGPGRDLTSAAAVFKPLTGIQTRTQIGALLEADGAKTGVELGVQVGRREVVR